MKRKSEYFQGCLIGGAVGDALGWPVEFMRYSQIKGKYGKAGIHDLVISSSGKAEITDDTQMTIFTAEGILRADSVLNNQVICDEALSVYYSYQRWLITQGYPKVKEYELIYDGWLLNKVELNVRRAPGNTCLSALSSRKQGSINNPINNSKGCGGIMRVAPAGLYYEKEKAFVMGAEFAAITHGHPSGYLSAGAFAFLIASLIEGNEIELAINETIAELINYDNHKECSDILVKALELAKSNVSDEEAISELGEGWVGEEALGISVYFSLKYSNDFEKGLIASVNHDGDSDSTGSITGNILGAYLGLGKIPMKWMESVELKDVLLRLANELLNKSSN